MTDTLNATEAAAFLQQLGGWSDLKMVMKYSHMADSHIKQYANNARAK